MKQMLRGVVLGLTGVLLWFMPLSSVGVHVYQTGREVENYIYVTYVLLASFFAYALSSCFALHKLRIVLASISTGISLLFLIDAGSDATWALYALSVVSGMSWVVAYTDGEDGKTAAEDIRSS